MFQKLIGFLWSLSVVASLILLIGKLTGDITVSWFAVPFPVMLILSVVALNSLWSFKAIGYIAKQRMEDKE